MLLDVAGCADVLAALLPPPAPTHSFMYISVVMEDVKLIL